MVALDAEGEVVGGINSLSLRKEVTEGALAIYVDNSDPDGIDHGLESRPMLASAVCSITAHYVLDLIDEEQALAALDYCDENMD